MNDPDLLEPFFAGHSWRPWKVVLKGAFGLRMAKSERALFRTLADRDPPTKPVKELWVIAGRRAGKDSIASAIATHAAALFNQQSRLRPGERALVMCLACDRDQAKIVLNYARSYFTDVDLLTGMVQRETADGFELQNGVDIVVATNSFRHVRGRTILLAIFDECSYWRDENYASPDEKVYRAIRPGMATLRDSLLVGISSPYRKSGLLHRKFKDHYGKNGDILVVKAPTTTLNPTIDQKIIDEALAADPAAARAEWLAEFRDDIAGWATLELIESAVDPNVTVRARVPGVRYHSFCDPSGGARDSFTCAISHAEGEAVVLDALLEIKAPSVRPQRHDRLLNCLNRLVCAIRRRTGTLRGLRQMPSPRTVSSSSIRNVIGANFILRLCPCSPQAAHVCSTIAVW
jgi:hypothetical protein